MPEVFRVLEDLENLHYRETNLDADLSLRDPSEVQFDYLLGFGIEFGGLQLGLSIRVGDTLGLWFRLRFRLCHSSPPLRTYRFRLLF